MLKRLALLAILAFGLCEPAHAAISIIQHVCYPLGVTGGTTTALNITGATNVSIGVVYYTGGSLTSVVDSPSDALNARTAQASTEPVIQTYDFDFGSAVSYSTYTVTVSGTGIYASACITAWSGGKSSGSFDTQDGNVQNGGATVQAASGFTPNFANEVLVSFLGIGPGSNSPAIDSSFGTPDCIAYAAGNNEGICESNQIQTTATFRKPTWSWSVSTQAAMTMDSYQAAPAGGACIPTMTLLHVERC